MEKLSDLFGKREPRRRSRSTERGDIYDLILARVNPPRIETGRKPLTYARLGYLLTNIPTKDLYALISKCDDAEHRGFPWGAIFWKEIRPPKKKP